MKLGDQVQDVALIYDALDFAVAQDASGDYGFTLRRVSDNALLLQGPVTGGDPTDTVSGLYSPDVCATP